MGVADSRYKTAVAVPLEVTTPRYKTATSVSLELTRLRIKHRYSKITTHKQFT